MESKLRDGGKKHKGGRKGQQATKKMDPPPAAGGAAADNAARGPACYWCQPVVSHGATRAQIRMAAAAAAFALFVFTLKPATFPDLPACYTTATEILELRFRAGMLLLCAMAQAGAATGALFVLPPTRYGLFLTLVANLLGLVTLGHLMQVVIKVLFATGAFCLIGDLGTAELTLHFFLAATFVWAGPLLWSFGQPQGRRH